MKVNHLPTRICHVIYCHGDKSYPCLKVSRSHNKVVEPKLLPKNKQIFLSWWLGNTWFLISSFNYCRTVRIEKQILSFLFLEKFWLDNFVLRSTDLQLGKNLLKLPYCDVYWSILISFDGFQINFCQTGIHLHLLCHDLIYFNTPKEAKTTKKSQQNACSDFIQTFLHPEETGPVSIITFFISIKKISSSDSS